MNSGDEQSPRYRALPASALGTVRGCDMPGTYVTGRRRVRVWFGAVAISDYVAPEEQAEQYEKAMTNRFGGLRITNEPFPDVPDLSDAQPLN
jgi:hypothetical protein